jgi:hypothetical protein
MAASISAAIAALPSPLNTTLHGPSVVYAAAGLPVPVPPPSSIDAAIASVAAATLSSPAAVVAATLGVLSADASSDAAAPVVLDSASGVFVARTLPPVRAAEVAVATASTPAAAAHAARISERLAHAKSMEARRAREAALVGAGPGPCPLLAAIITAALGGKDGTPYVDACLAGDVAALPTFVRDACKFSGLNL